MSSAWLIAMAASMVVAATPLLLAAVGELVSERAGVLNLGVEGSLLVAAIAAFAAATASGSLLLGVLAATAAGTAMGLLFAVLTLFLQANPVATGLALTLFGVGLSSFVGQPWVGQAITPLPPLPPPALGELPLLGPLLLHYDGLVYLALALVPATHWLLQHSRLGLLLRAVGESPAIAHASGLPVQRLRLAATLFGGACSGLAGAYLSLALTPMWAEGLSAGRGWIALALVVFAAWRPLRLLAGAWLFGGMTVLQLNAQGLGLRLPTEFLSMLPYLATLVALALIQRGAHGARPSQPAALGQSFHPDR